MHHHPRVSLDVAWNMGNLVNKNKCPITRTHENSSIEAPTPNRLVSS
jgi:hypothetical protein